MLRERMAANRWFHSTVQELLVETCREIRSRCKGRMAEYEIPKAVFEWEGPWPMTVVGKMDLKALEAALQERLRESGG